MAEPGQAVTGPDDLDDLAAFLVDNREADKEEEAVDAEDTLDEDTSESEEDAPADEDDDESDSEEAKKQTSGLKFKVPVKGEDGTDTSIEVDEKELVAGYQRHSDYTRKTQELANREREAFQVVTQKIDESRDYYMQQAQIAHAAVKQMAGLRSAQEMAQLAQTDPAAWVQEQQRASAIQGFLAQIEQSVGNERAQLEQQRNQAKSKQFDNAWQELAKDGIDKPKLAKIFDVMSKKYGVGADRLANVDDPVVVRIMRDAAAYNELKDKKAAVTKKVQNAPALPPARQSAPRNETQRDKALNNRFANGKAKLNDLAAYLSR